MICRSGFAILALSLVSAIFCAWQPVAAAPAGSERRAATDPSDADEDYPLMGEYVGSLETSDQGQVFTGLQIVALGDGQFDAIRYNGGLPGAGGNPTTAESMHGARSEDAVTLSSGDVSVTADGVLARVYDKDGYELGRLEKMHRVSPTMGAEPPENAVVLFDGTNTENLEGARITEDGLLDIGVTTKMPVRDFRLHLEFRTPYMPKNRSQSRGNSGVYIQRRYEVQILDSFGFETVFNGCGALYRQQPPQVNMSLPPLAWQTYDIRFTAARWDDEGNKTSNARITVRHNGVPIHDDYEIPTKTGAGRPEGPEPLPILLQNHGDPVRFRNVWIVLEDHDKQDVKVRRRLLGRRATRRHLIGHCHLRGIRQRRGS